MEDIFNIIFGIATFMLGIMSYNLNQQKNSSERRLEKLREYGERTRLIDHKYVDVILFGPRYSGKTSIAELWTSPWAEIGKLSPSETWRVYEVDIHEFEPEPHHDDLFDVDRTHIPTLRLRVRDYPGENSYRLQAVKDLKDLKEKAILLFLMNVGFTNGELSKAEDNAEYFSRAFVEEIDEHLQRIGNEVSKALVVFNKSDLLPSEWDDKAAMQNLAEANREALHQIERVFSGMLEYHLTSARTNEGLIHLLGSVGIVGIESDEERESFERKMQMLQQERGI